MVISACVMACDAWQGPPGGPGPVGPPATQGGGGAPGPQGAKGEPGDAVSL